MKRFNLPALLVFLMLGKYLSCQNGPPDTIYTDVNKNLPGYGWKFSFVQITDTHIGQGTKGRDYGTPGYNDSLRPEDKGRPAQRLANAIKWVNNNAERLKIKFVVFTGDLTNNAEKSQFLKFKQIADSLNVPYVPLMGNHDLWPYTSSSESSHPNGDSIINEIFADNFKQLSATFGNFNEGTRLNRTWYADGGNYSYFQNFSFTYNNFLFLFLDFSPRIHAPMGDKGIGPEADLLRYKGGTWKYFRQFIKNYPDKGTKSMFFFSHYPLTKHFWSFIAGFPVCDYIRITSLLVRYRESCSAWVAGHFHNEREHDIKTWLFPVRIMKGIETEANADKTNGYVKIIRVWSK